VISFVWSAGEALPAGTGGSENYTVGQVRELNRRGVAAEVVTFGVGEHDGRDQFPGVPFHSVARIADIEELAGTVVFATSFPSVPTRRPAYQILHVPPPLRARERQPMLDQARDRALIATSRYAALLWSDFLDVDLDTIRVVYPFAESCFGVQRRPAEPGGPIRVLYAGRLSPEKGIYTLLAMLHSDVLADLRDQGREVIFTATTAGSDKPQGGIIRTLLEAHPGIRLIESRTSPESMAALMAEHDVLVMPSNSQYWHETFGIVSIEAQHAGCRVVASDDGGLPETGCGALTLVAPDDPHALAHGLREAVELGPVSPLTRSEAATRFTVAQSVDQLLAVLEGPRPVTPAEIVEELEALALLPAVVVPLARRPLIVS
jgi:glycosyltransferase involved in cell wall biosynthesis